MPELSEEELLKRQTEAAQVGAMLETPGWAVSVDEINEQKEALTKRLIDENDETEKLRLQVKIRGLNFLLRFPEGFLEAARRFNEDAAPATDEASSN